jgi:uncharacterized protein (TIGR03790 family)
MHPKLRVILGAFVATIGAACASAAVTQENNVVVLVNSNSPTSIAIGNQYKTIHPGVNIATLNVSTSEVITASDYQTTILPQVQQYLVTNNLLQSAHYLVTTKGMPLKISGTGEFTSNFNGSSVDSELTLAGADYVATGTFGVANYSNTNNAINNPYAKVQTVSNGDLNIQYTTNYAARQTFADYKAAQPNGSQTKAMYLAARLDAYTQADVFAMLARAQATATPQGKTFVLDDSATPANDVGNYDRMTIGVHNSKGAREEILARGGIVQYDNTAAHLSQSSNPTPSDVMGYVGHGGNDGQPANYIQNLGYTLANGAMFSSYESFNANSFDAGGNRGGQGLIADWIQVGGTAATGTVWEPFAEAIAHEEYFFGALMDHYTFADAMWMSTEYLSWQNVMVGDPLMTWAPEPGGISLILIGAATLIARRRRISIH